MTGLSRTRHAPSLLTRLSDQPPIYGSGIEPSTPVPEIAIYQKNLCEREFPTQDAFVSARIDRMQHGVYAAPDSVATWDRSLGSGSTTIDVTFLTVSLVFHPMRARKHRFKRALVKVSACETASPATMDTRAGSLSDVGMTIEFDSMPTMTEKKSFDPTITEITESKRSSAATLDSVVYRDPSKFKQLRILKYGPQFQTPPTQVSTKDNVLKIQGSTRKVNRTESGLLTWSFEENSAEKSGLPRDFTFVILLERHDMNACLSLNVAITPKFSLSLKSFFKHPFKQYNVGGRPINLGRSPLGQAFVTMANSGLVSDAQNLDRHQIDPSRSWSNFNFATYSQSLNELVTIPRQLTSMMSPSETKQLCKQTKDWRSVREQQADLVKTVQKRMGLVTAYSFG